LKRVEMNTIFTQHSRKRMITYGISEADVIEAIVSPDGVVTGYRNRQIYQKALNGHILRVIVEEAEGIKTVVTVYRARRTRYEM
jgi:hypothetical protein